MSKKFYGWILVAVLWIVYFINASFPMYGAGVINSYMAKSLRMNRSMLGLGVTVFGLAHSFPAALIALSINRLGVRVTIFIGSIIISIGSLLMSFFVKSPMGYILVYGCIIGFGVGLGAMIPVQAGVTFWFKRKKVLAMSIVLTAAGIGGFIASPTVNKIIKISNGNWHGAWLFIAGLSMISALISILFIKNNPSDLGQVQDGFNDSDIIGKVDTKEHRIYYTDMEWTVGEAVKTRSFWLIAFGSIGMIASYYICLAHGVINLMDKNISTDVAAISMGLITLFSIFGRLATGFLGDKYETRHIYSIGLIILATGCFLANNVKNIIGVYIYAICIGIGFGASYVCIPIIYGNYYGSKVFVSIMGVLSPIQSSIGCISPVLAGIIYDIYGSYTMSFIGVGIIAILGSIGLVFAKPPSLSRKPNASV